MGRGARANDLKKFFVKQLQNFLKETGLDGHVEKSDEVTDSTNSSDYVCKN